MQEAIECVAAARDASRNSDPYVYTEIPDLPLENVFYEEGLEMYREQLEQLEARKAGADDDPDILLEVNEKIDALTKEMQNASRGLEFERAAELRDMIFELEDSLGKKTGRRKAGSPASLAASATCLPPQEHNMAPSAANKKTERRNIFI